MEVNRWRMDDVAGRVRKLIIAHLRVDEEQVSDNANFVDDLGADSLNAVELVLAFENEFGCKIPDDQVDKLATVQGAVNFIESVRPLTAPSEAQGPLKSVLHKLKLADPDGAGTAG